MKTMAAGMAASNLLSMEDADRMDGAEQFRALIEQSHEVKRQRGSISEWHEALESAGIAVDGRQLRSTPSTADVSATAMDATLKNDHLDKKHVDLTLTLATASCTDQYYAELTWHYQEPPGWDRSPPAGRKPPDAAAVAYENQWWRLAEDTISESITSSEIVTYAEDSYEGHGPGFKIEDEGIEDGSSTHWCGVFLEPVGDYGVDERRVFGNYVHTWNAWSWDPSISLAVNTAVGGPMAALSVTGSWGVKKWRTNTGSDGDTLLRLSQSDALGLGSCSGQGSILTDPAFEMDDTVEVTSTVNRRRHARIDEATEGRIPAGTQATVVGGPVLSAEGDVWYRVETGGGVEGYDPCWVKQSNLALAESAPPDDGDDELRFDVDDRVEVVPAGSSDEVGVYYGADTDSTLKYGIPAGTVGYVEHLPRNPDDSTAFTWYKVAFNSNVPGSYGPGWVKGKHLNPAPYDGPDGDEHTETIEGSLSRGGSAVHTYSPKTANPNSISVRLQGRSGTDFDLYLTTDGRTPETDDSDHTSRSSNSDEEIVIRPEGHTPDDLGLLVDAYSGSGEYTLTITEKGGDSDGGDGDDPDGEFERDQRVATVRRAAVRRSASGSATQTWTAPEGSAGYVRDGPVGSSGTIWWKVGFNAGHEGWIRQRDLRAAPAGDDGDDDDDREAPDPAFDIGQDVVSAEAVNVRSSTEVAEGNVEHTQPAGKAGTIKNGYSTADGFTWWRVEWVNGVGGWSPQRKLDPEPDDGGDGGGGDDGGDAPDPSLKIGQNVVSAETVNVRSSAEVSSGNVKHTQPAGKVGTVKNGYSTADRFTWWRVEWVNGVGGWSPQRKLDPETDDGGDGGGGDDGGDGGGGDDGGDDGGSCPWWKFWC